MKHSNITITYDSTADPALMSREDMTLKEELRRKEELPNG